MKDKGFPRFFIDRFWTVAIFVRIDNKRGYGTFFYKNGKSAKSDIVTLRICLLYEYEEIKKEEPALLL